MKTSFRQIAQKSRQELQSQYKLPEAMIEYYMSSKDFFLKIRAIRDSIFHYPSEGTMQPQRFVFCDDDGFAVSKSNLFPDPLGVSFDIWPQDKVKPNGLVSVLGLISYVNKMVLGDSDKFSDALVQAVPPPSALSESHMLFLRSPYVHHLLKSDEYVAEQWVKGDLESRLTRSTRYA